MKANRVHRFGAPDVITFEDVTGLVDAVIDTVGGSVQQRSLDVLEAGGVLVSSVSRPDPAAAAAARRPCPLHARRYDDRPHRIASLLDAGELAVRVGTVMPLADGRQAHEMLEGMRARPRGKIVLGVDL
jgi:NADPH:quinone reductase-like Zn-dependent oxidoreductase